MAIVSKSDYKKGGILRLDWITPCIRDLCFISDITLRKPVSWKIVESDVKANATTVLPVDFLDITLSYIDKSGTRGWSINPQKSDNPYKPDDYQNDARTQGRQLIVIKKTLPSETPAKWCKNACYGKMYDFALELCRYFTLWGWKSHRYDVNS